MAYDKTKSFIQNVLTNAPGDVGGIVTGMTQMPGNIYNAAAQTATEAQQSQDPRTRLMSLLFPAQSVGAKIIPPIATGFAESLNKMVGEPVKTDNGMIGLQTPSLDKAKQQWGEHPVSSALNALPFISKGLNTIKGLNKVSDISSMTPEEASIISPLKEKIPSVKESGPINVRNLEAPNVPDAAAKSYMKAYTIPSGMDVNTLKVGKWMVNDNPNLSKIGPFLDTVERIKNTVLDTATKKNVQVDIDPATGIAAKMLKKIPQLRGSKQISGYVDEINALFPNKQTSSTGGIGGATPNDAYTSIRNIEKQGYIYDNAARDAYGQIKDVGQFKVGQAFIKTAKELEKQLDSSIGTENVSLYTQSPAVQQAISQYSKPIADRLGTNVQNWSDLRALEAPSVEMNKVIQYTNRAGHSAFANLSGRAVQMGTTTTGAALGGALGGPVGASVGAVVGTMAEPFISELGNKYLPPLTAKVAQGATKLNEFGKAIKTALPILPQTSNVSVGQTPNNQGNGNNPQNIHTIGNIAQNQPIVNNTIADMTTFPKSINDIHPDKNGVIPPPIMPENIKDTDGTFLVVGGPQARAKEKELSDAVTKAEVMDKYQGTPDTATALGQAKNTLNAFKQKVIDSKDIAGYGEKANSTYNAINGVIGRLNDGNTINLLQSVPTLDALFTQTDPKYAPLKTAFQQLSLYYPNDIKTIWDSHNPTVMINQLKELQKYDQDLYNSKIREHLGISNQGNSDIPTGQSLPIQQSYQQSTKQINAMPQISPRTSGSHYGTPMNTNFLGGGGGMPHIPKRFEYR